MKSMKTIFLIKSTLILLVICCAFCGCKSDDDSPSLVPINFADNATQSGDTLIITDSLPCKLNISFISGGKGIYQVIISQEANTVNKLTYVNYTSEKAIFNDQARFWKKGTIQGHYYWYITNTDSGIKSEVRNFYILLQ